MVVEWDLMGSLWDVTGWWYSHPTPLKNMSSSIGMMIIIPNIEWENKKYSKPPTR